MHRLYLGKGEELARVEAVEQANRWTAGQAARLQTTPEVLTAAILRGWLPENIEAASSRFALEYKPPPLPGVSFRDSNMIDRKARAAVRRAKGNTAMALAYREAKSRAA